MGKQIIYVAHPVSGDVKANCDKVLQWLRWLTAADPSRIYIAPWVGEVLAHLDLDPIPDDFYDRVLSDDEEVVSRCDGILLVGGRMSTGMTRELAAARRADKAVFDMTGFSVADDARADRDWRVSMTGRDYIDFHKAGA